MVLARSEQSYLSRLCGGVCMLVEKVRIGHDWFKRIGCVDFIAPLAFRLYLFFPFYMAGMSKITGMDGTVYWFGEVLGLPFPALMAYAAAYIELVGAFLLLLGLAARYISIPLIITMLVAIFAVHWDNGWFAIASSAADEGVAERLSMAKSILNEHGNYAWLTAKGSFVILNNGIEFAVTYLIMLLSLLFTGAGRYVSLDYWVEHYFSRANRLTIC